MTAAVLTHLASWVDQHIYQVLADEEYPPEIRLSQAIDNIKKIYKNGEEICIFRALSMETGMALFGEQIKNGVTRWVEAFTRLGQALHMTAPAATQKAKQTFIDIQGSLVLAKAMDTTEPFEVILEEIKERYTKK